MGISLCEEFPDKNESTLVSAVFCKGKCKMDLQHFAQAKECFLRAITLQSKLLPTETQGKEVPEMIKESIFDTDEIKQVKEQLGEMQEYLEEIAFIEKNKA